MSEATLLEHPWVLIGAILAAGVAVALVLLTLLALFGKRAPWLADRLFGQVFQGTVPAGSLDRLLTMVGDSQRQVAEAVERGRLEQLTMVGTQLQASIDAAQQVAEVYRDSAAHLGVALEATHRELAAHTTQAAAFRRTVLHLLSVAVHDPEGVKRVIEEELRRNG